MSKVRFRNLFSSVARLPSKKIVLVAASLVFSGCAALFGWKIHAPGLLSQPFYERVQPIHQRLALYLPEALVNYQSKDRGGRFADPQTYFVGEAISPILIEAYQQGFDEFIFMEAEPTPEIMDAYDIPYLIVPHITGFYNKVTLKGQAIEITTRTDIYDGSLKKIRSFEASGVSNVEKIFAKKGGPEVNLNSALENNVTAQVKLLQDDLLQGRA